MSGVIAPAWLIPSGSTANGGGPDRSSKPGTRFGYPDDTAGGASSRLVALTAASIHRDRRQRGDRSRRARRQGPATGVIARDGRGALDRRGRGRLGLSSRFSPAGRHSSVRPAPCVAPPTNIVKCRRRTYWRAARVSDFTVKDIIASANNSLPFSRNKSWSFVVSFFALRAENCFDKCPPSISHG
jgi:hypothetical protein